MSSLPERMKMIQSKMKELEWSQYFSYYIYKSMGIFPQSKVRSGGIMNSFEMLWLFSLPARMKKIRSKMKALEWSQDFPHFSLWELSVAMETGVLIVQSPIWPNYELI